MRLFVWIWMFWALQSNVSQVTYLVPGKQVLCLEFGEQSIHVQPVIIKLENHVPKKQTQALPVSLLARCEDIDVAGARYPILPGRSLGSSKSGGTKNTIMAS